MIMVHSIVTVSMLISIECFDVEDEHNNATVLMKKKSIHTEQEVGFENDIFFNIHFYSSIFNHLSRKRLIQNSLLIKVFLVICQSC